MLTMERAGVGMPWQERTIMQLWPEFVAGVHHEGAPHGRRVPALRNQSHDRLQVAGAGDRGEAALADRSCRPYASPWQTASAVEAMVHDLGAVPVLAANGAGATGRTARGGIVLRELPAGVDFNPEIIFLDSDLLPSGQRFPEVDVSDRIPGAGGRGGRLQLRALPGLAHDAGDVVPGGCNGKRPVPRADQ